MQISIILNDTVEIVTARDKVRPIGAPILFNLALRHSSGRKRNRAGTNRKFDRNVRQNYRRFNGRPERGARCQRRDRQCEQQDLHHLRR